MGMQNVSHFILLALASGSGRQSSPSPSHLSTNRLRSVYSAELAWSAGGGEMPNQMSALESLDWRSNTLTLHERAPCCDNNTFGTFTADSLKHWIKDSSTVQPNNLINSLNCDDQNGDDYAWIKRTTKSTMFALIVHFNCALYKIYDVEWMHANLLINTNHLIRKYTPIQLLIINHLFMEIIL